MITQNNLHLTISYINEIFKLKSYELPSHRAFQRSNFWAKIPITYTAFYFILSNAKMAYEIQYKLSLSLT